ncbi:glutamate 5-kinase isoform 1 [Dorcoceras hygrometricum]|uniref:Glutamate 5-kinase isoform 1 n=1 Tax=Dorcoceras hygrometricum TaxID=472368 RepID=A0A2Z7CZB1_9LAMI|nr:glutamate 5-kinase isoform 1 [Dorcoceras hygrometricum]
MPSGCLLPSLLMHHSLRIVRGDSALTYRRRILLEVLRRDCIRLLSPNDQVISHRKRLGSDDLLNLSTWDLSELK